MRSRDLYPADVIAQASLNIAGDPETGNPDLADRTQEVIAAGGDPFQLVSGAIKNGRVIMERAEKLRLERIATKKPA